jgi:hypothetical protein
MISPVCFGADWLRDHAEAMKARDVKNLEKCVLALELVSRMHRAGLDFIFKGGTSLALVFNPVRRLSIDVDILSLEPDLGVMRDAQLEGPWKNLNRLKQTDLLAFACWHQAQEIAKR